VKAKIKKRIISNLLQGDCLIEMPKIPDNSIDMILSDPPYGTTACKWDSIIPLEPMWKQLKRIAKINAAIVMTTSQPFTTTLIASNMKMFRYEYIWLKIRGQNFLQAKKQFMKAHEVCLIFYQKQSLYNPQMTKISAKDIRKPQRHTAHKSEVYNVKKMSSIDYDPYKRYPLSYGLFPSGRARDKLHPSQKPIALMEYLIKTFTNEKDIVLDFAMGSGTTGIACKNLNRKFIGIELNKKYYRIALKRIQG